MATAMVIGAQWGDEGKGKSLIISQQKRMSWCVPKGEIMRDIQ